VGAVANYTNLALSPDEKRLALDIRDPKTGKRDLWMIDLARTTRSRFTFEAGEDFCAVFSPDGSRLLFTSDRTGQRQMYVKSSQGTGEEEKIADFVSNSTLGWSPDGRFVLYDIMTNVQNKLMLLDLTAQQRKGAPLLGSKFREIHGRISPDGKWVTYVSDESGRNEVYVQSFPPGKGKWQISNEGGGEPQWRGDGGELFYVNGDQMMAVPMRAAGAMLEPGLPMRLFEVRLPSTMLRNRWVVTKDGQKFLALLALEEKKPSHFNVVVNWPSLLERK
jgi:Tol biopolymer transport system component